MLRFYGPHSHSGESRSHSGKKWGGGEGFLGPRGGAAAARDAGISGLGGLGLRRANRCPRSRGQADKGRWAH